MDIIHKLYDHKGGKIRIVVTDGEYEGILKSLYADIGKISLTKVVPLPQRAPMFPLLHFFEEEIKCYSVVSEPVQQEKQKCQKKKVNAADVGVNNHGRQQFDVAAFLHQEMYGSDSEEESESQKLMQELNEEEAEYELHLPEHLVNLLPLDHDVITEIGHSFYLAIKHIKQHDVIGVGFEGSNIGRNGDLCWLTVSTPWCTFLFDICSMKEDAFKEGLKEILESHQILKVIHDSRQPSDALFHLYNTELANVFDTQVGDVFADMQNSKPGTVGKYVRPLRQSLIQYLMLKPVDFAVEAVKYSRMKGGLNEWQLQPLPNALKDKAIKNVIYLRLLRERLMEKMLRSFNAAVDVYLNVVRSATPKELDLEPSVPHMLPQALLSAGLQTFHMKKFPSVAPRSKTDLGFVEPVDEDPIHSYLKHVEKHEAMERKKEGLNCSTSFPNLVSKTREKGILHKLPNNYRKVKQQFAEDQQQSNIRENILHSGSKVEVDTKKCDGEVARIDRSIENKENSSGDKNEPFKWPTTTSNAAPSYYSPAGLLKEQRKCR